MASSQETAEQFYEAALFKKEVEGDLQAAIEIFRKIITDFPENRNVVAKSFLQLGMSYEKMGLKQAQESYQEIIDSYSEQIEEVKIAMERLAVLLRSQSVLESGDTDLQIRQIESDYFLHPVFVSPSPDGRFLSCRDYESYNLTLYELATGKVRLLTEEARLEEPFEYANKSIISPDGQWVAYNWSNPRSSGDLRILRLEGGQPRVLYSEKDHLVSPVSWSSDSQNIAAIRQYQKSKTLEIVQISVQNRSLRVLKALREDFPTFFCYSPDNRYIAYDYPVEKNAGNYDIAMFPVNGVEEVNLVKHPANDRLLGWVPGTQEVLFLTDRAGDYDICAIHVVDEKQIDPRIVVKHDVGQVFPIGFTQSRAFYFGKYLRKANTYIAALDLETWQILDTVDQPLTGYNLLPEWSPDGESLAYVTEHTLPAGPRQIESGLKIHSLETGQEREIRSSLNGFESLRWSPDGRSLLISGWDRYQSQQNYRAGLYRIALENGTETLLVSFDHPTFEGINWRTICGEWATDGKAIFYMNKNSIVKRDLASNQERMLYTNPNLLVTEDFQRYLVLSPDGQNLAFGLKDHETESESLMILPIVGGEPQLLHRLQGPDRLKAFAWTLDGKKLIFTTRAESGISLWSIDVENNKIQKLWESMYNLCGLRIHPDGQRIAFYAYGTVTEIWVMENFLPKR